MLTKFLAAYGLYIALAAGAVAIFATYDRSRVRAGETKVIERSKQHGSKANEKNAVVRKNAASPGAAERLLKDSCRDC